MRIPIAKDNVNKIAPDVSGIQPIAPVAADSGLAKAGEELKQSMQNAADGFVKLYQADQRADAIKYFNDYHNSVKEYRDSAEKDPKTGMPIGFMQLKGDQVNEDSLQAAQDKVVQARTKFDQAIRGFIPDLQDEFGMRADEVQANFDTASNAHFLKTKYEKAKTHADLDNENLKNNTYFGPNDVAKMNATYNTLYKNHYNYLQDDNAAKKLAQTDLKTIIENNTNRIMQEGLDTSYDDASAYISSPAIKKALGNEGWRVLKHKIDLEATQWQMKLPNTTTDSIHDYINKHTTNLTPKEKALFIAQAERNDKTRAGGSDKSESLWREMISRLGNAQPAYLSANNEFGINTANVTPDQSAEFQSRFLVFSKSLMGALNNTPYNEKVIRERGLDAILPNDKQLEDYRRGGGGELMRVAVNRIDSMLKDGTLPLLTPQQTSAIGTLIDSHISKANENMADEIRAKNQIENDLNVSVSALSNDNVSLEEINASLTHAREFRNLRGKMVVGQGNESYFDTLRKSYDAMRDKMLPAYAKENTWLERGVSKIAGAVVAARGMFDTSWFNPFAITLDKDSVTNDLKVQRNNDLLAEFNDVAYSDGKDQSGRKTVIGFLGKTAYDNIFAIQRGDGLTLMDLRPDGTPDTMTMQPKSRFAVDWFKPDGVRASSTKEVIMETAFQFQDAMNAKYNTNQFNDLNSINLDSLPVEDQKYLRELFNRNWLEANGLRGKTMIPQTSVSYEVETEVPMVWGMGPTASGTRKATIKAEDRQPYLSSLNFRLKDVKTKDFIGGVASNENLVTLLENGYVDGEDYSVQLALNNSDANVSFAPSEVIHDMLGSLAPYGTRSKYLDPSDGKIKEYYNLMNRVDLSATAALENDKTKQNARLAIQQEELALLDNILNNLVKDNHGLQKEDFLRSLATNYNVSDDTFKKAVDAYQKLHAKRLGVKRQTYMLVGALAPSQASISQFMKEDQESK